MKIISTESSTKYDKIRTFLNTSLILQLTVHVTTISLCLFLCHFFRRTVDCFAYFILYSESFRMEQVYPDSARSPLQEYIIKLNQRCLVQMDDSKYKAGRHLWPPLYMKSILQTDAMTPIQRQFLSQTKDSSHPYNQRHFYFSLQTWKRPTIIIHVVLIIC